MRAKFPRFRYARPTLPAISTYRESQALFPFCHPRRREVDGGRKACDMGSDRPPPAEDRKVNLRSSNLWDADGVLQFAMSNLREGRRSLWRLKFRNKYPFWESAPMTVRGAGLVIWGRVKMFGRLFGRW
ncbi:hypothetical protein BGZ60DRAFT_209629 [Tricladium varicosporioides]|nr:hypothetical protein BGZ60DRAFT_209629 [Hymenoscyphus varicosporioides]